MVECDPRSTQIALSTTVAFDHHHQDVEKKRMLEEAALQKDLTYIISRMVRYYRSKKLQALTLDSSMPIENSLLQFRKHDRIKFYKLCAMLAVLHRIFPTV